MVTGTGSSGNGGGYGYGLTVDGQSDDRLSLATLIEVDQQLGETTTYRIELEADVGSGDLPLLIYSKLDPGSQLSVLAYTPSQNYCLVKGPVHAQEIHLVNGGAGSVLTVIGSDRSLEMDRETHTAIWADETDSDAVASILANYGFTTDIQTTSAGHYTNKHSLVQRDSDLRFIRRLAQRNGYLFWITCDEKGVETAHFRPPQLDSQPQTSLAINAQTCQLQSLEIVWDVEQPTSVVNAQLDLNSLETIDGQAEGSPLTVLGTQDLPAISPDTRSIHLHAPVDDAGDLQNRSKGLLVDSHWFIRATGETSLHLTGQPLQAHELVELTGAGSRYSGKYLVAGVRHLISPASHRMELSLLRNGWA
jgi:phage protein D